MVLHRADDLRRADAVRLVAILPLRHVVVGVGDGLATRAASRTLLPARTRNKRRVKLIFRAARFGIMGGITRRDDAKTKTERNDHTGSGRQRGAGDRRSRP